MKQSSPRLSTLAARVLAGYEPTRSEIESLAGSVLSQDETPQEDIDMLAKAHYTDDVETWVNEGGN